MNASDKISFFLELINCNYELYIWEYDADLQLSHSNWTESIFSGNFLSYTGLHKLIEDHLTGGKRTPLILEAEGNLMWITGFLYEEHELQHIYLLGPIYSGRDSHMLMRKHLDRYELSVKTRSQVFKTFEKFPTIPGNITNQYAVMLHYCLSGEKISTNDLIFQSIVPPSAKEHRPAISSEHTGIWYAEQQLCKMFAEGNPNYKQALAKSSALSYGMKTNSKDSLRAHKNNSLVLLTLCSRACISGGLSSDIAYDLNDFYASRLEECNSLSELSKLTDSMLADYIYRVRKSKEETHISAPIQSACTYIKSHVEEPLSIHVLADRCGYSEYYFSHKFKEEIGVSVNDYILNKKIEQAKLLLSGTREYIQTISDDLSFSNRSYFYSCFQKQVGMSPSEYRQKYSKL